MASGARASFVLTTGLFHGKERGIDLLGGGRDIFEHLQPAGNSPQTSS